MSEYFQLGNQWLQNVANEMRREKEAGAAPAMQKITVREFIKIFRYERRGQLLVGHIRKQLEENNLHTDPDFEFEHIDNEISIVLDGNEEDSDTESISPTARVSSLKASQNEPVRVSPNDSIAKAITIMQCNNFSQLPVMTAETTVKGVISWRSIGKAFSCGRSPNTVNECMERGRREIYLTSTYEELTRELSNHDYVLVRGKNNKISGIVTAADLVDQFREFALPFSLIAEIEFYLRKLVRGKFTTKELSEIAKDDIEIQGPDNLMFGDYCQLLAREPSWEKLDSNWDRKEFVKCLNKIREIRNDVMHFSPDGIGSDDLEKLKRFAEFLREDI